MAEAERLSVLLLSGSFERAHYALAMASTAAALERPATLFVDPRGDPGLARRGRARAAGLGRPAARRPSWPSPDLADGAALDARNRARGVAGFEELLQACAGLGVEIIVCEMGLRALGLQAHGAAPRICRSSAAGSRRCWPGRARSSSL